MPAKLRSQTVRIATARSIDTSVANASAGTMPTRPPSSPITAAWTPPASPAVKVTATARPVPLDTGPSYTLRAVPEREVRMVRVFVVYEAEPDPTRYEHHTELSAKSPRATCPGTKRCAARRGASRVKYYAENEIAHPEAFKKT